MKKDPDVIIELSAVEVIQHLKDVPEGNTLLLDGMVYERLSPLSIGRDTPKEHLFILREQSREHALSKWEKGHVYFPGDTYFLITPKEPSVMPLSEKKGCLAHQTARQIATWIGAILAVGAGYRALQDSEARDVIYKQQHASVVAEKPQPSERIGTVTWTGESAATFTFTSDYPDNQNLSADGPVDVVAPVVAPEKEVLKETSMKMRFIDPKGTGQVQPAKPIIKPL